MKIRCALVTTGMVAAFTAAPVFAQADNTNSLIAPSSFDSWTQTYPTSNSWRTSREAYRDDAWRRWDAGRRWDAMDTRQQRLRVAEVNRMYGYAPELAPEPTRVKRGNSSTNPTGNELEGQNSGGK